MSEDKDQIINDLKSELEKARLDHEAYDFDLGSYKEECKNLESLLEGDVKKKEGEIKRIKQESLKKEKAHSQNKAKLAEMEKDLDSKAVPNKIMQKTIAELNMQLSKFADNGEGEKSVKLQQEIDSLKARLLSETSANQSKSKQLSELATSMEQLQRDLANKEAENSKLREEQASSANELAKREAERNEQIAELRSQLAQASHPKVMDSKKAPQPKKVQEPGVSSSDKTELKQLRSENDRLVGQIESLQRELMKSKDSLAQSQLQKARPSKPTQEQGAVDVQQFRKLERSFRDMKTKYSDLSEERNYLNRSLQQLQRRYQQEISQLKETGPAQPRLKEAGYPAQEPEQRRKERQNSFYVLIRTKKHYVSPFLQWNGRTLKMLKQTKTAFSKSLGQMKYNADWVGYDPNQVAANIVESLQVESYEERSMPSTVILFGAKHSAKKQTLIAILKLLMNKLTALTYSQEGLKLRFRAFKAKMGEPAIFNREFEQSAELSVSNILEEIIQLMTPAPPESEPTSARKAKLINPVKPKPKQQLRYLSIEFNEAYKLELITCSNCSSAGFKEHDTLQNSLQHLIYAHLPQEMHSSLVSNRHIVLPITPIVQQYDGCKLSLSLINQQHNIPKREKSADLNEEAPVERSPVREDSMINDSIRKKLENFEKENEQSSIKIIRLEQDCAYYRSRIEDFVVRIKNIISTQNKQNAYLKKSPMTLTLEKLQLSMSSILRKTSPVGRLSASIFQRDRNEEPGEYEPEEHESLAEEPEQEQHREESLDAM